MNAQSAVTKSCEQKMSADRLQHVNAQLQGFSARAKAKMEQAEIGALGPLKIKRRGIEARYQERKTVAYASIEKIHAEIDAVMVELKSSLEQLAISLKNAS